MARSMQYTRTTREVFAGKNPVPARMDKSRAHYETVTRRQARAIKDAGRV